MILNLEFKNYRSFKGTCSFTTEPTSSKAKVENLCEVETKAEGNKKALKIFLDFWCQRFRKDQHYKIPVRFQALGIESG